MTSQVLICAPSIPVRALASCERARGYDVPWFIYQDTFNTGTTATWNTQVENVIVALKSEMSDREHGLLQKVLTCVS